MTPSEHLAWFEENIEWFLALDRSLADHDVPDCPGWQVIDVVSHLANGLGAAYPYALSAPPEATAAEAFAAVPAPVDPLDTDVTFDHFEAEMHSCLVAFGGTEPDQPCFTYAGAGTASFWFLRAAIETSIHRMDVARATNSPSTALTSNRTLDAIEEAIAFALPFALSITGAEPKAVTIEDTHTGATFVLGVGPPRATIRGSGTDVLAALWGRNTELVSISGEADAAHVWLSQIETAFAGR